VEEGDKIHCKQEHFLVKAVKARAIQEFVHTSMIPLNAEMV
jgi:hypothetical protein